MGNNDCPECTRLNEIEARIRSYPILPEGVGPDQLVEDVAWLAEQLRSFQRWAGDIVNLHDPIKGVEESVCDLRQKYELLFAAKKVDRD